MDFWPFLKWQKMEFAQKKFHGINLFDFTSFFWPGNFKKLLPEEVPEEDDKQVFLAFNSWILSWELSSGADPVVVFVILAIEARFVATLVTRDFSEAVESFLDEVVLCKKEKNKDDE